MLCIAYLCMSQYLTVLSLLALTTIPLDGVFRPVRRSCTDSTLSSWPLNWMISLQSDVLQTVMISPVQHTTCPYRAKTVIGIHIYMYMYILLCLILWMHEKYKMSLMNGTMDDILLVGRCTNGARKCYRDTRTVHRYKSMCMYLYVNMHVHVHLFNTEWMSI